MENGKSCSNCNNNSCSAKKQKEDETYQQFLERQQLHRRICQIKHKVIVLSGKGGVGKSTVAVNIAVSLSNLGYRVGLLDIDVHGPSIPKLLNLEGSFVVDSGKNSLIPIEYKDNLKVMSIGFLLRSEQDAVIWRGPRKTGLIKQFLMDVEWNELDYLIIDSPPGTGDEPIAICQFIGNMDGAIIVTTPQKLSIIDVKKSINFCQHLSIPILGVIENMSRLTCPYCGKGIDIFKRGGGAVMAREMMVSYLGEIPIDPRITESGDEGEPFIVAYKDSAAAKAIEKIILPIIALESMREST